MDSIFLSAFLGASAAFIFLRLGDFINRIVQRKYLHITSLVSTERCLNENYDLLHENDYKFEIITKQYQEGKSRGYSVFIVNKVNEINFDNVSFNNITNMNYYNELLNYKGKLRRFNGDIETMFKAVETLKSSRLGNIISDELYMYNLGLMISKFEKMLKANNMLKEMTIDLLSKVRVLYKVERSLLQKLYFKLVKKKYKKDFNSLVQKEKNKVEKEIKNFIEKEQQALDKMFKDK
jgi:hypothetical protein